MVGTGTSYAVERFYEAASLLPYELKEAAERLTGPEKALAEEFRLRAGRAPMVSGPMGEYPFPGTENMSIQTSDLALLLEVASQASAHTVLDRVRSGFVTVRGGHRVGLCGSAVVKVGEVRNLRLISSAAIRIAREVPGAAAQVLPALLEEGALQSTLILSPPGAGKTTLLRDLVRCVSDGVGVAPLRVGLADERGEVAAMYNGIPQTDVGGRTDVMDGCPKSEALMMLLRGMNPQVLSADEVTAAEDIEALEEASGCGVRLLCTAHGGGIADLWRRPLYRRLMELGLFQRAVLIRLEGGVRHYEAVRLGEASEC